MIEDGTFVGLERGGYKAIVADPPWHYKSRTALRSANWSSRRDAEKHYRVMSIEAIRELPVYQLAHTDCHLFLWTTAPCLQMAFSVIHAWGFRYSTVAFTWIKLRAAIDELHNQFSIVPKLSDDMLHVGLGHTTRKNAEFCLLARKGNAKRVSKAVREVILAPVRQHSRKPDEMYQRVMEYCEGPYIDLFSRQKRTGWMSWGMESGKWRSSC